MPIVLRLANVLPFTLLLGLMLPLFCRLCGRYAANFTAVGVCAAFHTAARVDAAPFSAVGCRRYATHFTAVGAAAHTAARAYAPLFLQLCRRYAAHFTAVGAALDTAARVDAPFFAVGIGVTLPTILRLAFVLSSILLLGWMLPFLMRLVWTLPCRYTAAMVDTALLLQLLWTPPSILLFGWTLPLFSGCWTLPLLML